jgi:hypothetical protein
MRKDGGDEHDVERLLADREPRIHARQRQDVEQKPRDESRERDGALVSFVELPESLHFSAEYVIRREARKTSSPGVSTTCSQGPCGFPHSPIGMAGRERMSANE